jgi:hypothetical protein
MTMRLVIAAAIAAGMALFSSDVFARDAAPAQCDTPSVLSRIQSKFRHQAREVLHSPGLAIGSFQKVHEHRLRERSEFWPIARRYCGATATMTDGRERYVWYLIEKPAGFVGFGNNVEFCVTGLDRWNVYNGHCRVLR